MYSRASRASSTGISKGIPSVTGSVSNFWSAIRTGILKYPEMSLTASDKGVF